MPSYLTLHSTSFLQWWLFPSLPKQRSTVKIFKYGQVINSPSLPRISSNQHKRTTDRGTVDQSQWARKGCNSSPEGLPRKESSVSTLESSTRPTEICGRTHQCNATKGLFKMKSPEAAPEMFDLMAWLSLSFIHNALLISTASGMTTQYGIVWIVFRKAWVITTHKPLDAWC